MNSFSFFYIFCFYSTIFSTIYTDFQLSLKISFFALNLGILLCFLILLVISSSLACIALRSQFQLFFSLLFWTSFFTEDEALSVAFCLLVCVLCFFFFLGFMSVWVHLFFSLVMISNTRVLRGFINVSIVIICLDYFAFCFNSSAFSSSADCLLVFF